MDERSGSCRWCGLDETWKLFVILSRWRVINNNQINYELDLSMEVEIIFRYTLSQWIHNFSYIITIVTMNVTSFHSISQSSNKNLFITFLWNYYPGQIVYIPIKSNRVKKRSRNIFSKEICLQQFLAVYIRDRMCFSWESWKSSIIDRILDLLWCILQLHDNTIFLMWSTSVHKDRGVPSHRMYNYMKMESDADGR